MQIRRFFAKDMRNALAEVSRELGPDAAILSSRRIGGGVELLAAIDYDPSVLSTAVPRSVDARNSASSDGASETMTESLAPAAAKRAPAADKAQATSKKTPFEAFLELAERQSAQASDDAHAAEVAVPPRERSRTERNRQLPAKDAGRKFQSAPAGQTKTAASRRMTRFDADHEAMVARAATSAEKARRPDGADTDQMPNAPRSQQAGLQHNERQDLQADWPGPNAAPAGLRDLQEEVRQLRGLMQEQLQGLAWRDLKQRQPLRAMLTKRLAALELSPRLREVYASAEGRDVEQALATAYAAIARDIVNSDDAMLDQGGIYAFVGATGVGKTTTIAKLAARFALRHGAGSVALISTDSFRIAGHDQLATYARLIGCAVRTADSAASLQSALDSFVDRRLILIDTAGMSQRDARLAEQLAALASARYPVKQVLVLSATAQRAILQESVKQFGQRRVHGAILTKLDETTSLGAVLTVLLESRLPLMASCDGQRVPEDLRSLRGAQLVDRALKLAEQFRDGPDEWLMAQELPVGRGLAAQVAANPAKVTAHAGI
ncbi:flagellar biosynthesis protein FlhF [Permianibacter sp. IMCC34836]|uniref:flagellar biosynthesis protein FlhF n=1 Tax=Permianibacter fluminis TaxID=2738515 RepID=UPI001553F74D|nr:flagellar biosynthesis protein FlhF [Permianibacter fluminis]NQD38021.1 flagellar biosynthesis protein FlhF [Permianibacter fluminis]